MALEELKIIISLVDEVSSALKSIQENLKSTADAAKSLGDAVSASATSVSASVGDLSSHFSAATNATEVFGERLRELGEKLETIGKKMMVVGGAITGFVSASMAWGSRLASQLLELSKATGISADRLFVLREALKENEVNFDAIVSTLPRFSRQLLMLKGMGIEEFARMLGYELQKVGKTTIIPPDAYRAYKYFQKLTDEVEQLSRAGADQITIFLRVVKSLQQIRDETVRSALAFMLFRGAALEAEKLLRTPPEELSRSLETFRRIAPSAELVKAYDELGDAASTALMAVRVALMEAFAPLIPVLKSFFNAVISLSEAFSKLPAPVRGTIGVLIGLSGVLLVVGGLILTVVGKILSLYAMLSMAGVSLGGLVATIGGAISAVVGFFSGLLSTIVSVVGAILGAIGAIVGLPAWLVGLIIAAIVAVIAVIIVYWDKIKSFFSSLADWLSDILAKVMVAVAGIWDKVKEWFAGAVRWIKEKASEFFDAGRRIVIRIYEGIKSVIMLPINAIKSLVEKIRRYLPFSPAKEGALTDLDKVGYGFANTIVYTLRKAREPIVEEVRNIAKNMYKAALLFYTIPMIIPHGYKKARELALTEIEKLTMIMLAPAYSFRVIPSVFIRRHITLSITVTSDKYVDEKIKYYLEKELPRVLHRLIWGR
ncbi:Phage-related protein [Candidatus Fervidibacteria bacterium JGI MDM2 JNZ-1-D12]